jgi:transcriptional regulator with XRE-family HTH domain
MRRTRIEIAAERAAAAMRHRLGEDLGRLCADAGVSGRGLAEATGLPRSFVWRILNGSARPSLETYALLAAALGADPVARLYPTVGPLIRDRHQAPVVEALVGLLHPRWMPCPEARVRRPASGWIDLALVERRARLVVATEVESEINRLEQQIRWSQEKAASLPSWDRWATLDDPAISRLLVIRATRATRLVAADNAMQLQAAYPAHPADALVALTGDAPWPGPAILWARIDGGRVRFLDGR